MVYDESGTLIEVYSLSYLDEILNEGFDDFTRKVVKTAVELGRKILDTINMVIEYASRIPYHKIIKEIKDNKTFFMYDSDNPGLAAVIDSLFNGNCEDMDYTKYMYAKGYGKWLDNFNAAADAIEKNNSITKEEILNILYGKPERDPLWFCNSFTKNISLAEKFEDLVKVASELSTYTNPLRKSYSKIKVINASLEKGNKISVDVMAEMHYYCINAIAAYRNLSKMILKINKIHRPKSAVDSGNTEEYAARSEKIKKKYTQKYVKERIIDAKI